MPRRAATPGREAGEDDVGAVGEALGVGAAFLRLEV